MKLAKTLIILYLKKKNIKYNEGKPFKDKNL